MADIIITEEQVVRLRNFLLSENADLLALKELSEKQSKNKLNEEDVALPQSTQNAAAAAKKSIADLRKMIPTVIPTEKMGTAEGDARQIMLQYSDALGGKDIKGKLKNIQKFLDSGKFDQDNITSEHGKVGKLLSLLVLIEILYTIINDFSPSGSGFLFEAFLSSLFKTGKQVTTKVDGQLPITDITIGNSHYSLKLLTEGSEVGGSLYNLISFFLNPKHKGKSLKYIYAEKLSDGAVRISEIEITKEKLKKWLEDKDLKISEKYYPIKANNIDALIAQVSNSGDDVKFDPKKLVFQGAKYTLSDTGKAKRDEKPPQKISNMSEDPIKIIDIYNKTRPPTRKLSELPTGGSKKEFLKWLKDNKGELGDIVNQLKLKLKNDWDVTGGEFNIIGVSPVNINIAAELFPENEDSVQSAEMLRALNQRYKFSDSQFKLGKGGRAHFGLKFGEGEEAETADAAAIATLSIGEDKIMQVYKNYAEKLLSTIAPIYEAMSEFDSNLRGYFLGSIKDANKTEASLTKLTEAITKAGLMQTKTQKLKTHPGGLRSFGGKLT